MGTDSTEALFEVLKLQSIYRHQLCPMWTDDDNAFSRCCVQGGARGWWRLWRTWATGCWTSLSSTPGEARHHPDFQKAMNVSNGKTDASMLLLLLGSHGSLRTGECFFALPCYICILLYLHPIKWKVPFSALLLLYLQLHIPFPAPRCGFLDPEFGEQAILPGEMDVFMMHNK